MKNTFLILVAAGAGLYFLGKRQQVKKAVTSVRFQLKQVKLVGTTLIVKLGVLNVSNSTAKFNSLVGDLILNNTTIATAKNFKPITIKAAGETDIEVTLVPTGVGVVSVIADLIGGKKVKGFKFSGTANVNNILFPVNVTA
jgi:hypothetical protein